MDQIMRCTKSKQDSYGWEHFGVRTAAALLYSTSLHLLPYTHLQTIKENVAPAPVHEQKETKTAVDVKIDGKDAPAPIAEAASSKDEAPSSPPASGDKRNLPDEEENGNVAIAQPDAKKTKSPSAAEKKEDENKAESKDVPTNEDVATNEEEKENIKTSKKVAPVDVPTDDDKDVATNEEVEASKEEEGLQEH